MLKYAIAWVYIWGITFQCLQVLSYDNFLCAGDTAWVKSSVFVLVRPDFCPLLYPNYGRWRLPLTPFIIYTNDAVLGFGPQPNNSRCLVFHWCISSRVLLLAAPRHHGVCSTVFYRLFCCSTYRNVSHRKARKDASNHLMTQSPPMPWGDLSSAKSAHWSQREACALFLDTANPSHKDIVRPWAKINYNFFVLNDIVTVVNGNHLLNQNLTYNEICFNSPRYQGSRLWNNVGN